MTVKLAEVIHPDKPNEEIFHNLVGIDIQKQEVLNRLLFFFAQDKYEKWKKQHFPKGFKNSTLTSKLFHSPLIILSGEVGCGKTALAHSVATPLAVELQKRILVLETPSNIRGSGMVGELSSRVTAAFEIARSKVTMNQPGLLIIDEADDLATSRSQNQAHHEDRAGLNVLIKQMDALKTATVPLAVILITNRLSVLDPAIVRRADLQLVFKRPEKEGLISAFTSILDGTSANASEINSLVKVAQDMDVPYSYSDLLVRIGQTSLRKAISENRPFGHEIVLEVMKKTQATPLLKE